MLKEIGTNERSFLIDFAASVLPLENRDKTEKRLYFSIRMLLTMMSTVLI